MSNEEFNEQATCDPNVLEVLENEIRLRLNQLGESGDWRGYFGADLDQLEHSLQVSFQQQHIHLCSSGTFAVELALRGLKIQRSDQVILSAYDFPGNFRAVEALGATPVLVDLQAENWVAGLPPDDYESAAAMIVSPLYGALPQMDKFRHWCDATNTRLILDACQCPGATHSVAGEQQYPLSRWADATCLSFGGSKVLSAGRGGAVLTDSPEIAQRMRIATDRGNDVSPLSVLQAAVLVPQLELLNQTNQLRSEQVADLDGSLAGFGFLTQPMTEGATTGKRVFYKRAWKVSSRQLRDEIVAAAVDRFPLGAGFRGFAKRSARRCQKLGPLTGAADAAERVLLLDHQFLTHKMYQAKKNELCDFLRRFV